MSPEKNLPAIDDFLAQRQKAEMQLSQVEGLVFPELSPILENIVELTRSWNPVEIYTASNHNQEREKFLQTYKTTGTADNPRFIYETADSLDFSEAKERLLKLRRSAMDLAKTVNQAGQDQETKLKYLGCLLAILKINDDLATINMLDGIKQKNDAQTKKALIQKYGPLDDVLIAQADSIYQQSLIGEEAGESQSFPTILTPQEQQWLSEPRFDAEQMAAAFRWALQKYGFLAEKPGDFGFIVQVDDKTTSIDVRDKNQFKQPMILVPQSINERKRTGKNLLALIGHEIESHVRQSMNGAKLFAFGGGSLKIDGEALYEGLSKQADARFATNYFGEQSPTPGPYYIKAIELAQAGKNFREVFEKIVELRQAAAKTDKLTDSILNSSWLTTYRVFRGSTDPENSSAYAMPKDKGYLEGFLLSQQLEALGYDQYNQLAITTGAGFKMLGLFDVKEEDIPYPYLDLQREYWETVLKPQFMQEKNT